MNKKVFLFQFKSEVPVIDLDGNTTSDLIFDDKKQVNVTEDGQVAWHARTKKRPTSCHTSGHRINAGYTRSGKYKPSKWVPGKTDRRAGK